MCASTITRESATLPGSPRATSADRWHHGWSKKAFEIDPLKDARWDDLVQRHPDASLFHSLAWLKALHKTYGYRPIAFTTSAPGQDLENGLICCGVDSWLTGRRLVSLPFSDYCGLLAQRDEDFELFVRVLENEIRKTGWRYVELRPVRFEEGICDACRPLLSYALHRLDLRPDLATLYANLHKSSIQRKIRRAERENLMYREGSTESLLDDFYRLLVLTRRRHGVPPQPRKWFNHLMDCFGQDLKIRIASKDNRPVAAMITIRYKDALYYKYGGSDTRFNHFGGMHLLYWQAIQDAKSLGLLVFDFGRSDKNQVGLMTFKSRWGAAASNITYWRLSFSGGSTHMFEVTGRPWPQRIARSIFAFAPPRMLSALGAVLYKHIG